MNDDHYQCLSEITDQLLKFCNSFNQKREIETASSLIPITDDLTPLVVE